MDSVKGKLTVPVKAAEPPKRTAQQQKPETKPEPVALKHSTVQAPKPTTNTRGETLGRHLNVTA